MGPRFLADAACVIVYGLCMYVFGTTCDTTTYSLLVTESWNWYIIDTGENMELFTGDLKSAKTHMLALYFNWNGSSVICERNIFLWEWVVSAMNLDKDEWSMFWHMGVWYKLYSSYRNRKNHLDVSFIIQFVNDLITINLVNQVLGTLFPWLSELPISSIPSMRFGPYMFVINQK